MKEVEGMTKGATEERKQGEEKQWEEAEKKTAGEGEKTPETVMPGGSPEGRTKPWNAEEAQPVQGAAGARESESVGEFPADPGKRLARSVEPGQQEEYVSAFQALTGAGERIQILREDGSVEAFNPEKITQALEGAGASSQEAREIARRVESSVTTNLTTEDLENQVRAQVRRVNPDIERNWNAYKERSRQD